MGQMRSSGKSLRPGTRTLLGLQAEPSADAVSLLRWLVTLTGDTLPGSVSPVSGPRSEKVLGSSGPVALPFQ